MKIINSFNNTISINNVCNANGSGSADQRAERAEILTWLSPLDPRIRHNDISAQRVEHVGDWLLQTEKYRDWFDGIRGGKPHNSALFCNGYPGVGKTYISSLVVDGLCDWAVGRNAAVACFYFDFAAQKEQNPTSVLSSLLRQLVGGLEKIPAEIVQAFRNREKVIGGKKLRLDELVEKLQDITSSRPTFICVDALDECKPEHREKLLDSLRQILHKSPTTRIFLAGRLHIRDDVEKHLAGKVVAVSAIPRRDDIIQFLRAKLREDTTPDAMDESLEEDIIKTISGTISEIFLLVSLNIKGILRETTLHRRRERLGTMTSGLGLGSAYDATIRRIKAQERDRARLGMAALMWISHSQRPLNVDEICHALAVEIGSTHINANNVPSIRTVLGCCQGLAAVDNGSSTIRLIHFTLKEYLSGRGHLFDRPHSKIAETCLTYLNFRAIKDLSAIPSHDYRATPFLRYSSLYWGTHMRMDVSDCSRFLALDLLNQYSYHIFTELLWVSVNKQYFIGYVGSGMTSPELFSALHCISYFGVAEVEIDLIRTKRWDVNKRDSAGLTPLMWAARFGHEEVVKLLLRQEHTQPDIRDVRYGRTALSWAAGSGHQGVVRVFLGRQLVNPANIGRLWRKTRRVISVLFRRKYVNPNRPDVGGQTPLSWAAENGHDAVVKVLLGWGDVSPNRPNIHGQTPLFLATKNGHNGVVKLLLGWEDISPRVSSGGSQKVSSWAVRNWCHEVVKPLLEPKDVNPNRPKYDSQTLLFWAARNGRDGAVELLIERKEVDPDRPDKDGQTPLSYAAENGQGGVVKVLLEQEDVNPNRSDNYGETPLSLSSRNGHDSVVKLLLEREDIIPDIPVTRGQKPLSLAACSGHDGVVKLLLGREDVNLDRQDNRGRTPLWWAARYGHGETVRLLRARRAAVPAWYKANQM